MAVEIIVVDDTDHVREMLVSLLSLDGFEVVGATSSGDEAVEMAKDLDPDVIVMDYSMPGTDGITATRRIREARPKQSVILYTAYVDDAVKAAAEDAGAALVVGKVEGLETLERSISELCLKLGKK